MKNVSDRFVEKHETHVLYPMTFFRKFCRLWKTFVERCWPHTTIWRLRIACWIPKATNKHTQAV